MSTFTAILVMLALVTLCGLDWMVHALAADLERLRA